MKVTLFSVRNYEKEIFKQFETSGFELNFLETRLTLQTAEAARGSDAVCCFANDQINADVIRKFKALGIGLIALRSAGYNHVDLGAAKECSLPVVRVPEYSPYAVAEHAVAILLTLNRKTHRAYNRVRELNFCLEGLMGFDLHGKTVGVIGGGRIGKRFCNIMHGFGTKILVFDPVHDPELESFVEYSDLERLLSESDVISLHVPLSAKTHHLIDSKALRQMKPEAILLNTGRGALIDTRALVQALKSKRLGGAGLDVYEEEEEIFFSDLSSRGLDDDVLARLLTFPNVLVTAHQGFLTREAIHGIVKTTMENLRTFASGKELKNRVV